MDIWNVGILPHHYIASQPNLNLHQYENLKSPSYTSFFSIIAQHTLHASVLCHQDMGLMLWLWSTIKRLDLSLFRISHGPSVRCWEFYMNDIMYETWPNAMYIFILISHIPHLRWNHHFVNVENIRPLKGSEEINYRLSSQLATVWATVTSYQVKWDHELCEIII
jgi:hypothetical protein